jgi:hypothetical protein
MIIRGNSITLFIWSLLVILLGWAPRTLASIDVYGMLNMGSLMMKEDVGANSYTNKSTFGVGHWGYAIGTRAKLNLGAVGIGVVGELSWIGNTVERKLDSESSAGPTYRNESHRSLAGGSVSINTGPSAIVAEYYPWVQNSIIYSDDKSQNPFRKNDRLRATGYGVGFLIGTAASTGYQIFYKKLQYKNVQMNGVDSTLPNDQYQTPNLDELSFGFALKF